MRLEPPGPRGHAATGIGLLSPRSLSPPSPRHAIGLQPVHPNPSRGISSSMVYGRQQQEQQHQQQQLQQQQQLHQHQHLQQQLQQQLPQQAAVRKQLPARGSAISFSSDDTATAPRDSNTPNRHLGGLFGSRECLRLEAKLRPLPQFGGEADPAVCGFRSPTAPPVDPRSFSAPCPHVLRPQEWAPTSSVSTPRTGTPPAPVAAFGAGALVIDSCGDASRSRDMARESARPRASPVPSRAASAGVSRDGSRCALASRDMPGATGNGREAFAPPDAFMQAADRWAPPRDASSGMLTPVRATSSAPPRCSGLKPWSEIEAAQLAPNARQNQPMLVDLSSLVDKAKRQSVSYVDAESQAKKMAGLRKGARSSRFGDTALAM